MTRLCVLSSGLYGRGNNGRVHKRKVCASDAHVNNDRVHKRKVRASDAHVNNGHVNNGRVNMRQVRALNARKLAVMASLQQRNKMKPESPRKASDQDVLNFLSESDVKEKELMLDEYKHIRQLQHKYCNAEFFALCKYMRALSAWVTYVQLDANQFCEEYVHPMLVNSTMATDNVLRMHAEHVQKSLWELKIAQQRLQNIWRVESDLLDTVSCLFEMTHETWLEFHNRIKSLSCAAEKLKKMNGYLAMVDKFVADRIEAMKNAVLNRKTKRDVIHAVQKLLQYLDKDENVRRLETLVYYF